MNIMSLSDLLGSKETLTSLQRERKMYKILIREYELEIQKQQLRIEEVQDKINELNQKIMKLENMTENEVKNLVE